MPLFIAALPDNEVVRCASKKEREPVAAITTSSPTKSRP